MKKNMERVPQALLDEINKAFVDLEEACLAPLYREYRLRRRTLKREYNNCDYPDSHIQINIGPIEGAALERDYWRETSDQIYDRFNKNVSYLNMLAACINAAGLNGSTWVSTEDFEYGFHANLPPKRKTVNDLKKAKLIAEQCNSISSSFQNARAVLEKELGSQKAAQIVTKILKKNRLQEIALGS